MSWVSCMRFLEMVVYHVNALSRPSRGSASEQPIGCFSKGSSNNLYIKFQRIKRDWDISLWTLTIVLLCALAFERLVSDLWILDIFSTLLILCLLSSIHWTLRRWIYWVWVVFDRRCIYKKPLDRKKHTASLTSTISAINSIMACDEHDYQLTNTGL